MLFAVLLSLPLILGESTGTAPGPEITLLSDLGLILAVSTVFAFLAAALKQPLIPAYILAGILIGPIGSQVLFGVPIVNDPAFVKALSELGITFLLFTVGIELDLSRLKDIGIAAVGIGAAQVSITFIIGFLTSILLGFSQISSMFLGFVVSFSSTMVVIKILADRDELETLHGRIMLGILLMQDVIVVVLLSVFMSSGAGFAIDIITASILKAVGLFSFAIILSRYLFPHVLRKISRSVELVFLLSLSVCFFFTLSSYVLGFSTAIGGFLGGISLAIFPYNLEISSRIKPLRDFFAIIFFVSLGMQFIVHSLSSIAALLLPLFLLTLLVIFVKPMITTLLAILLGYERRTAFLSGVGMGQVSEFSLILVFGMLAANATNTLVVVPQEADEVFSITILMAVITISFTPYLIEYGNKMFIPFSGFLERVEKLSFIKKRHELEHVVDKTLKNHVIVFGAHIMGNEVVDALQEMGKQFIVVDHNPEIIKRLIRRGVQCIYGDLEDPSVQRRVELGRASLVISTVPDEDDNLLVLKNVREKNPNCIVFLTAKTLDHAIRFYREGADFVIHLKLLGGREASDRLKIALREGRDRLLKRKLKEIELLEKKKREEIIGRVDKKLLKDIDELKAQEELQKSSVMGEE